MEAFRIFFFLVFPQNVLEYKTNELIIKVPYHPGVLAGSQPFLNKANNYVKNEAIIFFPLLKEQ